MHDDAANTLVLATANPHKVEELRAILAPASETPGLTILGLSDLLARGIAPLAEPEEIGRTFEHNAAIKALSYAAQTGLTCLADDSGLEIDALDGRPGVISSHYFNGGQTDGRAAGMGRQERDRLNNARVLEELRGVPVERRTARFVCVMAVAGRRPTAFSGPPAGAAPAVQPSPGATLFTTFRGTFEGRIGLPISEAPADRPELVIPRGRNGFGYDPLFLVAPDFTRTGAELAPDVKNTLSHRASAAGRLLEWLRSGRLGVPG